MPCSARAQSLRLFQLRIEQNLLFDLQGLMKRRSKAMGKSWPRLPAPPQDTHGAEKVQKTFLISWVSINNRWYKHKYYNNYLWTIAEYKDTHTNITTSWWAQLQTCDIELRWVVSNERLGDRLEAIHFGQAFWRHLKTRQDICYENLSITLTKKIKINPSDFRAELKIQMSVTSFRMSESLARPTFELLWVWWDQDALLIDCLKVIS